MNKVPSLDLSECTGCEACLELCPDVFKLNKAGYIEVASLSSYSEECIQEAINCCPSNCISWEESGRGTGEEVDRNERNGTKPQGQSR